MVLKNTFTLPLCPGLLILEIPKIRFVSQSTRSPRHVIKSDVYFSRIRGIVSDTLNLNAFVIVFFRKIVRKPLDGRRCTQLGCRSTMSKRYTLFDFYPNELMCGSRTIFEAFRIRRFAPLFVLIVTSKTYLNINRSRINKFPAV